jgi:hypothetical protein
MLPEAYENGREAAFDGLPQHDNPYPPGTKHFAQWDEGWRDAMHELHGGVGGDDGGDDADTPTII